MKYLIVLGDGMADYRVPELSDKTPLEAARKENIDSLAIKGEIGLVKTVPEGIPPGSDSTNLAIMGYNPAKFYTGRSPLEAVSIGINMNSTDLAVRCNLVTLSEEEDNYADKKMLDYSSDEITTEEASQLITYINNHLGNDIFKFHSGISYRHCLIWANGPLGLQCTPPHDILEQCITEHLPKGREAAIVQDLMIKSYKLLKDHPVNLSRKARGLRPANSVWLWGEGRKPELTDFSGKFGIKGSVISAVDLIKGIGICAGLKSVEVPGATGTIHTNFDGKAQAAIKEFESGSDFVYVHLEAPDECGHRHEIENKKRSIELIDEKIVGPLYKYLDSNYEDYAIMILPDHPTPLALRTHTSEPVPYLLYRKKTIDTAASGKPYNEYTAKESGIYVDEGYKLIEKLIK